VLARRHKRPGYLAKSIVLAGIAATALVFPLGSASAQNGIFDSLFGRRWNSAPTAYADPSPQFDPFNPFGSRPVETPRTEMGGTVAYCVRLCDGRFFPIQPHGGMTPAQACSSFCPASQTKIYNGGSIDQAVGPDGKPYRELSTAFSYREKIVPGCTCNGKNAFGLVNTPLDEDPTLRPGDIVATNGGLMAYSGNAGKQSFTPIASYSGLSAELRQRLTETKIAPASPAAPAPVPVRSDAKAAAAGAGPSRRVEIGR